MLDGEYIEIQGDLVTIIRRDTVRQTRLQDVLAELGGGSTTTFPVIGRTQVFAHIDSSNPREKRMFVLTEIPPGIKSIEKNLNDGTARRYRLAMPWSYLWFECSTHRDVADGRWAINEYKIFHSRERFTSLDQEMIVARLPNVYSSGRICWGATGASPNLSLADRVDQLTNEWYASRFNTDLDGEVRLPYGEANYRRWVEESRTNVNCWQNWPEWNDGTTKYTVRRLLAEYGQEPTLTEIISPDAIPVVPQRLTYGRWEEWWRSEISPEERRRAWTAFGNIVSEEPDFLAAVPDVTSDEIDDEDDGGTPVEVVY